MSDALTRERSAAVDAARAAGERVRYWYERTYTVAEKGPDNPLTQADLEANAAIQDIISRTFPDDGWLSEETRDSPERLAKRRVWIIDPLDGTKEFINRIPEFCICIGLVEDGVPILGVGYNPAREELFVGSVGSGLTLNGAPAGVGNQSDLGSARILASRSETARGEWHAYEHELRIELTGSVGYKLALIAAGHADATFSLTPKNEWDICAGTALITCGGGIVTDRFGAPLRFNRPDTRLPGIIAANPALHTRIVELLQRHGEL